MQPTTFLNTPSIPPDTRLPRRDPSTRRQAALMACALGVVLGAMLPASSGWLLASASRPLQARSASHPGQLSSSNVHVVFLDRDQVLWAGTNTGVDRFDGRWHSLNIRDGLPQGAVRAIAQTPDGALWFGGQRGLARASYDPASDSWIVAPIAEIHGPVYALLTTEDGRLWAGTDFGIAVLEESFWTAIPLLQASGLPARVLALAAGADNQLWAGGDALHRVDARSGVASLMEDAPEGRIRALLVTPAADRWQETLWVGAAGQGLWSYTDHWRRFIMPQPGQSSEGLASNDVMALAYDSDGTLWVGTNGSGVSLFHRDGLAPHWGGKNWRTLTTRDGLAADAVASIAIDSSGTAWLGTIAGVSRLETTAWQKLTSSELPAVGDTTTVFVDGRGRTWFGSDSLGLVVVEGRQIHHLAAANSGLPENMVRSVVVDGQDRVWVGTARQGIARTSVGELLNPTDGAAPQWQRFDGDLLGSNVIRSSLAASDGVLWFGTYNGVHRYDPTSGVDAERWTSFTTDDGLSDNIVSQNAMAEDADGNLWVGASTGINRLDQGASRWTKFSLGEGAGARVLSVAAALARDAGYSVWAGSEAGAVYGYDRQGRWEEILQIGSPVYALLPPDDGYLWIGSAAGLIKVDVASGIQRLYTRADGLPDNEVHLLARDGQDAIWIGTRSGVLRHVPEVEPPTARIVSVNGRSPEAGSAQILAHTAFGLAVDGADVATDIDDLVFRLRMVGSGDGWQVRPDRHWSFQPLTPGRYTLEVQAVDGALNFSDVARITLNVTPSVALPVFGRVSASLAFAIVASTVTAAAGLIWVAMLTVRNRKRRRAALRRRFNPYISGEPVAAADMFFGRQETLARIVDTLHENSIMIHGERRIGKTSLLLTLVDHLLTLDDRDFLFVPVYIDLEGTLEVDLFGAMMEPLVRSLPRVLRQTPALRFQHVDWGEYDHREFAHDLDIILEELARTTRKAVRVVLVLDEMDVINNYQPVTQQQLRRLFMRSSQHSLGAVVAGVNISKFWERVESPWYNLFNEVELGPLSEAAVRELILEPVRGIYQVAPEAVAYIALHSHGKPYLVQQHCMEAVNLMLAAGRTRIDLGDARRALAILRQHRRGRHDQGERRALRTQARPSQP